MDDQTTKVILENYMRMYVDCSRHGRQYNTLCIHCFHIETNRRRKEFIDNKKWWQFWYWGYDGGINRVDGYPDN